MHPLVIFPFPPSFGFWAKCDCLTIFQSDGRVIFNNRALVINFHITMRVLYAFLTCRYGAIVMDDQNEDGSLGYTVLHNCSCQHSAPTFINLVNAAILRLATQNKNMTIQTRNHPLPMTESQHLQRHVCYPLMLIYRWSIEYITGLSMNLNLSANMKRDALNP